MRKSITTCLLAATLAISAFGQENLTPAGKMAVNPRGAKQAQTALDGSLFNLTFIKLLDGNKRHEIFSMIDRLFGRRVNVRDGGSVRKVSTIQLFGDSLVVYETAEMGRKIASTVKSLNFAPPVKKSPQSKLEVSEYRPRFISPSDAYDALRPFTRNIDVDAAVEHSATSFAITGPSARANVEVLNDRGILIMRDLPAQLEKMTKVLQRIDKPKAQFMVSCMLIQSCKPGAENQIEDARLSKILPQELREISPYKTFQMISSGVIRLAAGSGRRVTLSMTGVDNITANLAFKPTSFDPQTWTLGLGEVSVDFRKNAPNGGRSQQSFTTSTTIQKNDHVVIGAFGDNPVFAVLRLVPIK